MNKFITFCAVFYFISLPIIVLGASEPNVLDVRLGKQGELTRLVIELDQKVQFSVFILDDPYRLVIDLPVVTWSKSVKSGDRFLGVVDRFRFGRFDDVHSRIVLDLNQPIKIERSFSLVSQDARSYRLVLDLSPVIASKFTPDIGPPISFQNLSQKNEEINKSTINKKPIIVIDPGHGGVDPGALGVSGIKEKELTLAAAFELQAALEETGNYRVQMTRNSDRFIPLQQRVEIARQSRASLFISIHADSIHDKGIRGASVYTLSENASDKEAEKLAARENRADAIGGLNLKSTDDNVAAILISLAQREAMNSSAEFANLLIPEISKNWNTLRNTHRYAGFAVLKAPDVPSVLLELGFISNRIDEQILATKQGRKPILDAVVRSINSYFMK